MTSVDNVIPFPKPHKNGTQAPNLEEVRESIELQKELDVDEVVIMFSTFLVEQLALAGYTFNGNHAKDLCMVFEGLRSLLHKYHSLEHPLQEIAARSFKIGEDGVHFFAPTIVDDSEETVETKEETPDDDSGPE